MKYDVNKLTLEEKVRLLTGKDWWRLDDADGKLPAVELHDGPHGVRCATYTMVDGAVTNREFGTATAMPALSMLANTWNTELARLDGATIADEFIEKGKDVLLGPGVNIKRTPLCGRNFEYFSEDPYLSGVMGRAFIEGVESRGIGACVKHYCANNREYDRDYQSSEVDERTLREIYLTPFELALEGKPRCLMTSYNPINGVYSSENEFLMRILRKEFHYDGLVMSDWYGVRESGRAHRAGLDLEMPFRKAAYGEIMRAYEAGELSEETIDAEVARILVLMESVEASRGKQKVELTAEERHAVARRIAEEGIVLLKNEDGILPLRAGRIHVSGPGALTPTLGGGGSSMVRTEYKLRHLGDEIRDLLGDAVTILKDGSIVRHNGKVVGGNRMPYTAYGADTVVLSFGTDGTIEFEDADRTSIRLPKSMEDLILDTADVNENVVVVLYSGSAIDVSPWIDKVKALLYIGYGGEAVQEATARVLCGVVSPSGKLSETFPLCLEDTPTGADRGTGFVDRYTEGIFVGYRYYDSYKKEVAFPFGYGLSYADFEYSDIEVVRETEVDCKVLFTVTNRSDIPAKEIAQLYVKDVFAAVSRPEKELRGFVKLDLAPGESKRAEIRLDSRAFAYYSLPLARWYVENGAFELLVGSSSRDIRLKARVDVALPTSEQVTPLVR